MIKSNILYIVYWLILAIAQVYYIFVKGMNDGFYWNVIALFFALFFLIDEIYPLKNKIISYKKALVVIICINIFFNVLVNLMLGSSMLGYSILGYLILSQVLFLFISIWLFFIKSKPDSSRS